MFNKYRLTAIAIALVIAGLFGWWFVAASTARERIDAFSAALTRDGWRVEPGDSSISGMPLRLNYNFTAPSIETANGAWRWSPVEAHIRQLLYRSDFFQLGAPGRQTLKSPFSSADLTLRGAAASLRFGARGYPKDRLSRLSVVITSLEGDRLKAEEISAHFGPTEPIEERKRRLFAQLRGLTMRKAAPTDLTLRGEAYFDRPLSAGGRGVPEVQRVALQGDGAAPGVLVSFAPRAGVKAELTLRGDLERVSGGDGVSGWSGLLAFETDQGAAVIAQLGAMGLLDEASQAALSERLAASGRLAGVLKLDGDRVEIHDIAPEPIRIKAP